VGDKINHRDSGRSLSPQIWALFEKMVEGGQFLPQFDARAQPHLQSADPI